jgi:hypothetical protein
MALIYDLADPQELQGYVRGIQQEVEENPFSLAQFLPSRNIDDIEYRVNRGQLQDQDAAKVRPWDVESPIGNRQGISRIMGELPPISKKIPMTEEQRLRQRALDRGDTSPIIDAIYDDAGNMARAVLARIEMLRGEALETGSLVINENGVTQTIDFGRDASMEPAALAGTDVWSDYDDSDPIQNLTDWVEDYVDENGEPPALALTSRKVINHLLRNDTIRTLVGTIPGGAPAAVNRAQLNTVLGAYDLPPLVAYDSSVRVDGTQVRVISDDKVIFLPSAGAGLGDTFFGTTAEALELVDARQINSDQAPGLVAVVQKTFDPVHTWTKAAAIALPVLVNPNLTLVADVI